MKNQIPFLMACAAIAVTQVAYSEGTIPAGGSTGSLGVNRRVITNPAATSTPAFQYCGVRGIFDVPTIFVPLGRVGIGLLQPNRANSKPTFYLGASAQKAGGNFEVDAGVQYEWRAAVVAPYNDPSTGASVPASVAPPGYLVFVRNTNADFTNNQFLTAAGGWRCGPGTLNPAVSDFRLDWSFERRGSSFNVFFAGLLKVDAAGANAQPRDPNDGVPGRFYAANGALLRQNLTGMRMKRVVGITQGAQPAQGAVPAYPVTLHFPLNSASPFYEEDGSYMIGCKFTNGEIATNAASPSWVTWDSVPTGGNIDQTRTGSSPGPTVTDRTFRQPAAIAGTPAPGALPVFAYSTPSGISIPSASTAPSRYRDETVDINLRRAVPIVGEVVTPGTSSVGTS